MKRLGDRVVELERMVQSSRLYLEDIAHKMDKTGKQTELISFLKPIYTLKVSENESIRKHLQHQFKLHIH